ncbi:ABC transporter ATP-binding protein/permease [Candidatus Bipolaricaulota bacterium]|nr:ABC transporter ATP-binding protein/permease [Candidatus Bipolaricaulota bacterium]
MSDHFQGDEILGKAFDAQLMRRLLRFLKPYHVLFVVCVLLTIGLAGIQLVIPYFTKTAIDSFMTLPHSIVQLAEAPTEGFPIDLGNGKYLVETLNVSAEARREWEDANALSVERYLFISKTSRNADYPERFPDLFTPVPSGWIASDADLGKLPIDELEALRGTSIAGIIRLALMFLLALLAQFVFGVFQVYLLQYTGQRVMYDMRQEIFAHVLRLPLKFFDHAPVGRLVTRVTSDVQAINEMFTSMLVNLFRDAFLIFGIMVVIFRLDWRLALAIFAFFPVIVFAAWQFRNRVRTAYREVRKQIARLNAYLQESISGMRIIQVFVQEHKANERFDEINQSKYVADMRQLITFAVFRPLMSFLSSFAIALVIWYGGFNVLRGSLSLGALTAFIQYVRMLFEPVLRLSEGYNVLQGAMASSERIFRLLDEPQEDPGRGITPESFRARIEFKDVWFAYDNEDWILKGVSFIAEPGQHVAIVGPTGSGKTTIIRILLRMYPIQKGQILIDGVPLEEFDLSYLRAQMAVVLQDVFMFSGDIMDNIKLRSAIPEETAMEAARFVNADFVEALPDGYHTEVKERGVTLSVGERQLLSFARAVAFNPKILVLDEATASIDSHTESLIQNSLRKIMQGRTSIVIAHRLSTIREADNIIVLHLGKLLEQGTHDELLDLGGLYAALHNLQFSESSTAGFDEMSIET